MVENFFFIRWRCCFFCGIVTCLLSITAFSCCPTIESTLREDSIVKN